MNGVYRFGEYRINAAQRELWRGDQRIALPPQVFDFLAYLVQHHDRAVGREEIVAAVWGKTEVSDTLLGQTVLRIRRELGDDAKQQRVLRTIPRFGYRWAAPLEPDETTARSRLRRRCRCRHCGGHRGSLVRAPRNAPAHGSRRARTARPRTRRDA